MTPTLKLWSNKVYNATDIHLIVSSKERQDCKLAYSGKTIVIAI